jgi:hypothetical protein
MLRTRRHSHERDLATPATRLSSTTADGPPEADGAAAELDALLADLARLIELDLVEPVTDDAGAMRVRARA